MRAGEPRQGGAAASGIVDNLLPLLPLLLHMVSMQVESFALILLQLLQAQCPPGPPGGSSSSPSSSGPPLQASPPRPEGPQLRVVDFGSSTGSLVLPLAALFPSCSFTAVDLKASALALLAARAEQAGLGNVATHVGAIQDYAGECEGMGGHIHRWVGPTRLLYNGPSCQRWGLVELRERGGGQAWSERPSTWS